MQSPKSLAARFVRILYPYGSVRTVLRGPLKGFRFIVQPGLAATLAWGLDNLNLRFLASKIRPGHTVYDVGANCGQTSLFFSRAAGPLGRVLAFEPVPGNFALMQQNLGLNSITNVEPHELALDQQPGSRRLMFDPSRHTMGVFAESAVKLQGWRQFIEVRCESADHLVSEGKPVPDVMKIDVEGAAADVIAGAERLLERSRPSIYLELHALSQSDPEMRLLDELRSRWNYKITCIGGDLEKEPGIDWGAAVWCEHSS